LVSLAAGVALLSTPLLAQDHTTKTTTKKKGELSGGKKVTVTGCLAETPDRDYVLMDVSNGRNETDTDHPGYRLVTDADLSKYEGERVEVKGQAVENGQGKVSIESTVKKQIADAPDEELKTKMVATSGVMEVPFLGVKSMKRVGSCR